METTEAGRSALGWSLRLRVAAGVLLLAAGTGFALAWAAPGLKLSLTFFLFGAVAGTCAAFGWLLTRRRFYDWLQYVMAQVEPEGVSTLAEDDKTQAVATLQTLLGLKRPLPAMSGFGMTPGTALYVASAIIAHRPRLVVELGSGVSTVIMAKALQLAGGGRLVSVDHLPNYMEQTRALLREEGVDDLVELRHAPLKPWRSGRRTWYDPDCFSDLEGIDLLLVDGPPSSGGRQARYPALRVMAKRFSPGALILLDDTHRRDERRIVERWARTHNCQTVEQLRGGKGMTVVRWEGTRPTEPS